MAEKKLQNLQHKLDLKNQVLDLISEAHSLLIQNKRTIPVFMPISILACKWLVIHWKKFCNFDILIFKEDRIADSYKVHKLTKKIEKIRGWVQKEQSVEAKLLNYKKNGTPFLNELKITPIFGINKEINFLAVENKISAL